jgi:hypothetical protein
MGLWRLCEFSPSLGVNFLSISPFGKEKWDAFSEDERIDPMGSATVEFLKLYGPNLIDLNWR